MLDDSLLEKPNRKFSIFYKAAVYSYLFPPAVFIIGTFPLFDLHFLQLIGIFSVIPAALVGIICASIGMIKQRKAGLDYGIGFLMIVLGVLLLMAGFAIFGLLFAALNMFS